MCCMRRAENTARKISFKKFAICTPSHNFVGVYLRNYGMYRQLEKNLLNTNISSTSSTCSHNMVNFGPLAAEIGLPVWGTPANSNRFRVLASVLAYCTDVAQRTSTKLCTMLGRLLGWYTIYGRPM